MFKKDQSRIRVLTDTDMLLMFGKGIRGGGGGGGCVKQYVDMLKPIINTLIIIIKIESSYLVYLDANNLYGYAMSKKLPIRNFKWLDKDDIKI